MLTSRQQDWTLLLEHIQAFLSLWQQQNQHLHVDQHTLVYRLYTDWRQERDEPLSIENYGLRLRPLLCKDAEQQSRFMGLWHYSWEQFQKQNPKAAADLKPTAVKDEPFNVAAKLTVAKSSALTRIAVLGLLLTLMLGFLTQSSQRQLKVETPVETQPEPTKNNPPNKPSTIPTQNTERPYLKTVPQHPPPVLQLNDAEYNQLNTLRNWLLSVWVIMVLGFMSYIWWRRRIGFERHYNRLTQNREPLFRQLPKQEIGNDLFSDFNTAAAKLRFTKVSLNKVHWGKTIAATVRRGGFPQLRYQDRYRQLEIVIINDSRHLRDQAANLMAGVTQVLKQAQLNVYRYDFDRLPDWCWLEGDRTCQPLQLEQVLANHPNSRVLLVTQDEVLFYRISGDLQDWLKSLVQHKFYQLALLGEPELSKLDKLQRLDIPFRVVSRLSDIGSLLNFHKPEQTEAVKPQLAFDSQWLSHNRPDDIKPALVWLNQTLCEDGLRLLRVLAMYPELKAELTLALYKNLAGSQQPTHKTDNATITPGTLLKTIALPWCRQGWLPQWLRLALLKDISDADYKTTHAFFINRFNDEGDHQGNAPGLFIHKPAPFWQRIPLIQKLHKTAGFNSPLRDPIFTKILVFPHNPFAELALAKRVLKNLPNTVFSNWGSLLALSFTGALLIAGFYGCWQWQGENWAGNYWLQQKWQQHQATLVSIRYRTGAEALKDSLGAGFSALGYRLANALDDTIDTNRITAPQAMIQDIDQAARYLSWGIDFSQVSEGDQVIIELAGMPQTGQVFRDELSVGPQWQTRYPNPIPWQPEAVQLEASKEAIDSTVPIEPKMVDIPAGEFMMGSAKTDNPSYDDEKPQHLVKLAAFKLAATELTFNEWDVCVNAKVCKEVSDQGWGRSNSPVINVSWYDAQIYINWLNQRLQLTGKKAYRLPTEAEWEYAARAGTQTPYYWGNANIDAYAWYFQNSKGKTQAVGQKSANAWGLYDMSGNVWEWVEDCWHENYVNAPSDGSAWLNFNANDCKRSVRGGSWFNSLRWACVPPSGSGARQMVRSTTSGSVSPGRVNFLLFSFSLFQRGVNLCRKPTKGIYRSQYRIAINFLPG